MKATRNLGWLDKCLGQWRPVYWTGMLGFEELKGVVRDFGHRTSFPASEPVCYLSLETVFNTFHSVLLFAEIAGARQVEGNC